MSMCIVRENPVVFSIHSRIKQNHRKVFNHNIRSISLESVLCIILIDLSEFQLVMILSLVLTSLYSAPISL